jgi:hypothetical protein
MGTRPALRRAVPEEFGPRIQAFAHAIPRLVLTPIAPQRLSKRSAMASVASLGDRRRVVPSSVVHLALRTYPAGFVKVNVADGAGRIGRAARELASADYHVRMKCPFLECDCVTDRALMARPRPGTPSILWQAVASHADVELTLNVYAHAILTRCARPSASLDGRPP